MGTDWANDQMAFESSDVGNRLVKPPFALIGVVVTLALVSAGFFLGNSTFGYLMSIVASIAGGLTALFDQKRRGDSNYASYSSFGVLLGLARYSVLAIAIAHIARLAFDVARGGSIF